MAGFADRTDRPVRRNASAFFAIIVPSVALQGGYMIGLTGRDLIGSAAYLRGGVRNRSESNSRP
jgi:hypothetical protein